MGAAAFGIGRTYHPQANFYILSQAIYGVNDDAELDAAVQLTLQSQHYFFKIKNHSNHL